MLGEITVRGESGRVPATKQRSLKISNLVSFFLVPASSWKKGHKTVVVTRMVWYSSV